MVGGGIPNPYSDGLFRGGVERFLTWSLRGLVIFVEVKRLAPGFFSYAGICSIGKGFTSMAPWYSTQNVDGFSVIMMIC